MSDAFAALFTVTGVLLAWSAFLYLRMTKTVYITDYQAGVKFRHGIFYKVLGPGFYRTHSGNAPITIVDMRPHQFLFERLTYQDQSDSLISIAGSVIVSDPHLAVTSFKDLATDPITVAKDELRVAVTRTIADTSEEGRSSIASSVTTELNGELRKLGVEVRDLEVTELWTDVTDQYSLERPN
jgi:regulator of protease activity HflC (stomatin/prohibitin superfamily)